MSENLEHMQQAMALGSRLNALVKLYEEGSIYINDDLTVILSAAQITQLKTVAADLIARIKNHLNALTA